MRKIILTIEDDQTYEKISGSTDMDVLNMLYESHGVHGIVEMLIQLNKELDKTGSEE